MFQDCKANHEGGVLWMVRREHSGLSLSFLPSCGPSGVLQLICPLSSLPLHSSFPRFMTRSRLLRPLFSKTSMPRRRPIVTRMHILGEPFYHLHAFVFLLVVLVPCCSYVHFPGDRSWSRCGGAIFLEESQLVLRSSSFSGIHSEWGGAIL